MLICDDACIGSGSASGSESRLVALQNAHKTQLARVQNTHLEAVVDLERIIQEQAQQLQEARAQLQEQERLRSLTASADDRATLLDRITHYEQVPFLSTRHHIFSSWKVHIIYAQ